MGKDKKDNERLGRNNVVKVPVSRHWSFTVNNWTERQKTCLLEKFAGFKNCKYVFQEEVGKKGTPHLQGCVSFASGKKLSQVRKICDGVHWERARNVMALRTYCRKVDSRSGAIYSNMAGMVKKRDDIMDKYDGKLLEWQERAKAILKAPKEPRKIHWFWSMAGLKGKSMFMRHMCINNDKFIKVSGKGKDIFFGVKEDTEAILYDIPRTAEGFVSWGAMEDLKNGHFYSGKYESSQVIMNDYPHIMCFANFPPDESMMSADRWNIVNIDDVKK